MESIARRLHRLVEPVHLVTYVSEEPIPDAALAAREEGSVATLRRILSDLTDDLATPPYDDLDPSELDQLIVDLQPIAATLDAAGSR